MNVGPTVCARTVCPFYHVCEHRIDCVKCMHPLTASVVVVMMKWTLCISVCARDLHKCVYVWGGGGDIVIKFSF
jgi:hypothetical protein